MANLREDEVRRRRGELVEVDAVRRRIESDYRFCRSMLLAVPSRIAARLHLSVEQTVILREEIELALTRLADGADRMAADGDLDALGGGA